tara:strand:+ start:812 stop:1096 length:285 start_codon:yes stop_codon:yes gene_type:complete
MMGIGFPELMVILIIIMIIFGAGKLPEIGSAFGRSIKNFKTSMKEAEENETASIEQPAEEGGQVDAIAEVETDSGTTAQESVEAKLESTDVGAK